MITMILLMVVVLSGCVGDMRPPEDPVVIEHVRLFEGGRRAASRGDIRKADDKYRQLINNGNRYGEYGLAIQLLRRETGSREAVKYLLACAKRSSYTSKFFPDTAMDSAFSAAAMAKLSGIAISEHDRRDIADSLREKMADIVTDEVKAWANAMKTNNADSAMIYGDVISAVESCRQNHQYVKVLEWDEISKVLLNEESDYVVQLGGAPVPPRTPLYSVVKFVKTPGTTCKYDFEVRLNGNGTFKETGKVQSDLRCLLMKEFLAANPHDGGDDVRISISSTQHESMITGSAVVMKVSAVRLEYDGLTRRGKIAVRLDGRDVSAARKWALENVGELANGKNVVLVSGKSPPPGASFSVGNERMTEDGLLEIEFRTE